MSDHIYIHVPFCLKKCRYCDFYSQTDLSLIPGYVKALIREIELRSVSKVQSQESPVKTVYFGGGTPSVMPLNAVETILNVLDQHYGISFETEITFEANPGTLDIEYLRNLAGLGINRLSLGLQAFDDKSLALLGRIHSGGESLQAFRDARTAGFQNVGLDLIYGLPGQSRKAWQRELEQALALDPEHLSCYMLTLEPDTPLYTMYQNDDFIPMKGENQVDLFLFTSDYLKDKGWDHYEISNFARTASKRSRHNCAYWNMVPYSGFGPSAHSYNIYRQPGKPVNHIRSWNQSDLGAYLKALSEKSLPVAENELLTKIQLQMEMVMVGLRTSFGFDVRAFDALSASSSNGKVYELIKDLEAHNLGVLSASEQYFALTRAGWARLDSIVESFASIIL